MKNLKSVLEEFRSKFLYTVHPTETAVPGTQSTTYWNKDVDPEESLIFLQSSLIYLLEECVPEEKGKFGEDVMIQGWNDGYNACRQKLLNRIATITKL